MKFIGVLLVTGGVLLAQQPQTSTENPASMTVGALPLYRASVTTRTVKAVNYRYRRGATKIDFQGTDLLPSSHGEAKVESKKGYMEIEVEFRGLEPATAYGTEYLTYVMWAITPEGRASNLGEVLLNGTSSKLNVTTELQTFGLVVTAEPYFAVTQPSDLIVMENVVRPDTAGKVEEIDAKYELLQRGQYQRLANPLALKFDRKQPLELYEARNAVQIARTVGANRLASETFKKAENSLAQAEAYQDRHAGQKPVAMMAREAVQTAEDARAIAVKRQEDEAISAERKASADRAASAENSRIAAQSEADRVTREAEAARVRAQADAQRLTREKDEQAANSLAEAERTKRDTDARALASAHEADLLKGQNDAQLAAAAAEADRVKRDNDARAIASAREAELAKAQNDAQIAAAAAETDRLRRENEQQKATAQAELDNAAKQKAQLESERSELRTQLLRQFSAVLQTRDTARGLVVNMSDVLFDTGKFTLRPLAREKLAKVAGIVSGHPGLRLDVEGYTDSIGGDDYNQRLSEQRSSAVRDYLTQQGMASDAVTTKGFGKNQPVASNDTAGGRQQNRRVELVISGEIIGTQIGTPIAAR